MAPRTPLPAPQNQALQTALAAGNQQDVRTLLLDGADPFVVAPQFGNDEVKSLLRTARRGRRLLPAGPAKTGTNGALLQALRELDLPLARRLLQQEVGEGPPVEAWRRASAASRPDLLAAVLVVHGDERIEGQLMRERRRGRLNSELHRPLQLRTTPELTAYLKEFAYYSEKPERQVIAELNLAANFDESDEPIACRHLAMAWMLQQENTSGKSNPLAFASVDAIRANVPHSMEDLYDTLIMCAPDVHVRANTDWGAFAAERFRILERVGASSMSMLIESSNHVMAVQFKVKREPGQAPQYVQKVYDPNLTTVHKRANSGDLDRVLVNRSIESFLQSRQQYRDYFGEHETTFLAVVLPPGGIESLPLAPPGGPVDRRPVGPLPPLNEGVLFSLLGCGCGGALRDIKPALVHLAEESPDRAFSLLTYRNAEGTPGMHMAMVFNMADAVAAFCDIVRDSPFPPSQKAELLSARTSAGLPGLTYAMGAGLLEAPRALIEGIRLCSFGADLHAELLRAPGDLGSPALCCAMDMGHGPAVRMMFEGLARSGLPSLMQAELMAARRPDGATGLAMAMQGDKNEVVREFIHGVANSAVLNLPQRHELLCGRVSDGRAAVSLGVNNAHSNVVRAFVHGLADAALPADILLDLLLAKNSQGNPMLLELMKKNLAASVGTFVEALTTAKLPWSIKIQALRAQHDGRTALEVAAAHRSNAAAAALREAIGQSPLRPDEQARLLNALR